MLRHVIAPARRFAQIPNDIIRHPRLSSHAVHLLAWQVSLPSSDTESLSATAQHARIKKTAFQNAKRELLAERFLHEWRVQVAAGKFRTVQLISNVPLTAEDALAVRDGRQPAPGRARVITSRPTEEPAKRPTAPSAGFPTVGEPTGRCGGRQPKKNTGENTSNQPPAPEREPQHVAGSEGADAPRPEPAQAESPPTDPEPGGTSADIAEGEALLRSLGLTDRRLAMPARTARRWAPLAARWHATGLRADQIRHRLTHGLADARSPLGALRWRLEYALPDAVPPPAPSTPAAPRHEPRVARMRECAGAHTQPRLFLPPPGSDERRCADCRADGVTDPGSAAATADRSPEADSGYQRFRAARRSRHAVRPPALRGLPVRQHTRT